MVKYLKLSRITAWPTSLFSFAVGFGAGAIRGTDWANALFGFLAVFSFFAFAFALNFYSDKDVDRFHDGRLRDIKLSRQPLVTGEVTATECQIFCLFTFLLSIAFGWLAGGRMVALLIFGACLVGGILYSYPSIRLKSKPVADILCMACLSALLFSAGYVVAWGELPTWLMFLFFAIFSAIIYIPTVISDYEFDSRVRLKTSAVVFGQRNLMKATWVIWLCSLPVAWFVFSGSYPLSTKVCVVLACVASGIWTALATINLKPPILDIPVLNRHSREAIIYFGVISLIFIGWGLFKLTS